MTLCSRCERFDLRAFSSKYPSQGYLLLDVVDASYNGCTFCNLLLDSIEHTDTSVFENRIRPFTTSQPRTLGEQFKAVLGMVDGPLQIHFWVSQANLEDKERTRALHITHLNAAVGRNWQSIPDLEERSVSFHTAADPETPALTSGDVEGVIEWQSRPWPVTQFETIKAWHQNCRKHHTDCNKPLSMGPAFDLDEVPLPSRYIEIGNGSLSDKSGLTFILRESNGSRGRYITLSHRWTQEDHIARTTRDNYLCRLGQCSHASPFCTIWKTAPLTELFTDACWLAVNLGINKIWIDSVCIIQDDITDWEVESVKMAQYYQYAWLTISATHTNSMGGLRNITQTGEIPRIARLPYRNESGNQLGSFFLQAVNRSVLAKDYQEVSDSTLLKRGWVFQEWLLSRRTLSFTSSSWGIFMQCQNGDSPKAANGDTVKRLDDSKGAKATVDKAFKDSLRLDMSSKSSVYSSWRSIVESYSGLELSHMQSDRVVALSGVAAEYGKALEAVAFLCSSAESSDTVQAYACGLWLQDSLALLWEKVENTSAIRMLGFPTWSWASLGLSITVAQSDSQKGVAIQWREDEYIVSREILFKIEQSVALHVDATTWLPDFSRVLEVQSNRLYGNDSRFTVLKLRGRLLRMAIGSHLNLDERLIATKMTADHTGLGTANWRRVSTYSDPETIAGWASTDHPELEDSSCTTGNTIFAFFMSKKLGSRGMFALGNLFSHHVTYRVLYLKKVERPQFAPCYERVGVGSLFELEVDEQFESLQEDSIWLV